MRKQYGGGVQPICMASNCRGKTALPSVPLSAPCNTLFGAPDYQKVITLRVIIEKMVGYPAVFSVLVTRISHLDDPLHVANEARLWINDQPAAVGRVIVSKDLFAANIDVSIFIKIPDILHDGSDGFVFTKDRREGMAEPILFDNMDPYPYANCHAHRAKED